MFDRDYGINLKDFLNDLLYTVYWAWVEFVDVTEEEKLIQVAGLIQTRIKKLSDATDLAGFMFRYPHQRIMETYTIETLSVLDLLIEGYSLSKRDGYEIIRIAVCGQKVTPPLKECMIIMGRKHCIYNVAKTIEDLT